MTKKQQIIECMREIEDGMGAIVRNQDIWQNRLIYWLCKAVLLLLRKEI